MKNYKVFGVRRFWGVKDCRERETDEGRMGGLFGKSQRVETIVHVLSLPS